MLEYIIIAACYIIEVGALIWVLGARLGHGDERSKPRMKEIEAIDVERV